MPSGLGGSCGPTSCKTAPDVDRLVSGFVAQSDCAHVTGVRVRCCTLAGRRAELSKPRTAKHHLRSPLLTGLVVVDESVIASGCKLSVHGCAAPLEQLAAKRIPLELAAKRIPSEQLASSAQPHEANEPAEHTSASEPAGQQQPSEVAHQHQGQPCSVSPFPPLCSVAWRLPAPSQHQA